MKTATLDAPAPPCRHLHRRRPLRPRAAASDQHPGPPRTPPAGRRHRPPVRDRGPPAVPAAWLLQPVRLRGARARLQRRCRRAAHWRRAAVRRPAGCARAAARRLADAERRRGAAVAFDRQRRRGSISGTASSAPAGSAPPGSPAPDGPAADATPPRTSAPPSSPPLVLDAAGRQKLVEEAAGKSARQVRRMLADLDPELATPADRMRLLGDGRYELRAVGGGRRQAGSGSKAPGRRGARSRLGGAACSESRRHDSDAGADDANDTHLRTLAEPAGSDGPSGRYRTETERRRHSDGENSQANWQMIGGESPLERRSSRSTTHREPCAGVREGIGEASAAVRAGTGMSVEREMIWSAETIRRVEGNTDRTVMARSGRAPRRLRTEARAQVIRRDLGGLRIALVGRHQGRKGKARSRSRR